MVSFSQSMERRGRGGSVGRIILGLGAGVGFAWLAWTPKSEVPKEVPDQDESSNLNQTAVRQQGVTEDAMLPQFDRRRQQFTTAGDAWTRPSGRAITTDTDRFSVTTDGAGRSNALVSTGDAAGPALTVPPHSRSPP
ncbi:MAG: hypothetical protein ACE5F9_01075 [Phycisphaerae bacterium]